MKRRMLSMALVLVMLLGMVSFPAYAEEGSSAGQAGPDGVTALNGGEPITPTQPDGAGTEASPYQIGTAAELFWFAALVNGDTTQDGVTAANRGAWAVLTANITIPEGRDWTPIGNYSASTSNQYTGTFDGQDHTIDGMVVNNSGSSYQGFVGYLGGSGCIRNLTLGQGCSVTGKDKVGGICGSSYSGTIANCYATGTVSGGNYVGGVCGSTNEGTIPFP